MSPVGIAGGRICACAGERGDAPRCLVHDRQLAAQGDAADREDEVAGAAGPGWSGQAYRGVWPDAVPPEPPTQELTDWGAMVQRRCPCLGGKCTPESKTPASGTTMQKWGRRGVIWMAGRCWAVEIVKHALDWHEQDRGARHQAFAVSTVDVADTCGGESAYARHLLDSGPTHAPYPRNRCRAKGWGFRVQPSFCAWEPRERRG